MSKYHLGPGLHAAGGGAKWRARSGHSHSGRRLAAPNWPGGSYDPETHTVYVYACNSCLGADRSRAGAQGNLRHPLHRRNCRTRSGNPERPRAKTPGADSPKPPKKEIGAPGYVAMNIDGLPLVKPPYGTISAINLDKGEISWQIAHGETDDVVAQ